MTHDDLRDTILKSYRNRTDVHQKIRNDLSWMAKTHEVEDIYLAFISFRDSNPKDPYWNKFAANVGQWIITAKKSETTESDQLNDEYQPIKNFLQRLEVEIRDALDWKNGSPTGYSLEITDYRMDQFHAILNSQKLKAAIAAAFGSDFEKMVLTLVVDILYRRIEEFKHIDENTVIKFIPIFKHENKVFFAHLEKMFGMKQQSRQAVKA